jgi:hypothetical protein
MVDIFKTDGCYTCHQLGKQGNAHVPKELGHFTLGGGVGKAYLVRQAMTTMSNNIGIRRSASLELFAD